MPLIIKNQIKSKDEIERFRCTLLKNQEGEKTVDRVEVNVVENEESGVSQMLRIEDKQDGDSNSLVGKQYVTKGTHYLRDEEVVNVVGESRPLGFDSDSASASESNQ